MGRVETLGRSELLTGLDQPELALLHDIARQRLVPGGETIFELGAPATELMLVVSGTASLIMPLTIRGMPRRLRLEEKGPNAVMAWSALVPPYRYTLGATAETDLVLECMERGALSALFREHPRIHLVVTSNLCMVISSRLSVLQALLMRDLQRWVETQG